MQHISNTKSKDTTSERLFNTVHASRSKSRRARQYYSTPAVVAPPQSGFESKGVLESDGDAANADAVLNYPGVNCNYRNERNTTYFDTGGAGDSGAAAFVARAHTDDGDGAAGQSDTANDVADVDTKTLEDGESSSGVRLIKAKTVNMSYSASDRGKH